MKTKALLQAVLLVSAAGIGFTSVERVAAQEPGWTPRILKLGEDRERINSLAITRRPYRPFHVYGNTVRRLHYRGNPLPTPEDLSNTLRYGLLRIEEPADQVPGPR